VVLSNLPYFTLGFTRPSGGHFITFQGCLFTKVRYKNVFRKHIFPNVSCVACKHELGTMFSIRY
jgi:hypothetical protein